MSSEKHKYLRCIHYQKFDIICKVPFVLSQNVLTFKLADDKLYYIINK